MPQQQRYAPSEHPFVHRRVRIEAERREPIPTLKPVELIELRLLPFALRDLRAEVLEIFRQARHGHT